MTEVLFYHLEQQPLERVLPLLVQKTLERGWRAVIQTDSEERVEALSALLWTFSDESFIAHGTAKDGYPHLQPVWITHTAGNSNGATVGFFTDGTEATDLALLQRAVILFNGADGEAVEKAREQWRKAKTEGHGVSYWQQDEHGRWVDRAAQRASP